MKPTHECMFCGARWIVSTESWELWSGPACQSCAPALEDGAGMEVLDRVQISEIDEESDIFADMTPAEYADEMKAQRQVDAEHDARGSCAVCVHYRPDPEAGRRYFGKPSADFGWCTNTAVRPAHQDDQFADMLSGDWCQQFERVCGP